MSDIEYSAGSELIQDCLDAVNFQHRKPKANQWMYPKLLDDVPMMPAVAEVRCVGRAIWPVNYLAKACADLAGCPDLTTDHIRHMRQMGIKIVILPEKPRVI